MNYDIEVDNNQSGIYRILNKVNGKFYIGSTVNLRKRMREHLHGLKNNKHVNNHLQNTFNKHGESAFEFIIVEYVEDYDELINVEQVYLDELKPYDSKVGYNISKCATTYRVTGEEHHHYGIPKTEEQRRKTSEALKGHRQSDETKIKISESLAGKNMGKDHWSYGKERSAEHRRNQSKAMKGKNAGASNPSARKIVQLTVQGDFVNAFDTMREASLATGTSSGNIVNCCKGRRKTTGGYKWMYLEVYEKLEATQ